MRREEGKPLKLRLSWVPKFVEGRLSFPNIDGDGLITKGDMLFPDNSQNFVFEQSLLCPLTLFGIF